MRLDVDHQTLSIILTLDGEPADVDLTADELGEGILDLAVEEMLNHVQSGRSPHTGGAWPPNSETTKRMKGHGLVGYRTGRLLDPSNWTEAARDVTPRSAVWTWAGPDYGTHFHNGGDFTPPRHIVGWTAAAEAQVRAILDAASAAGRPDE